MPSQTPMLYKVEIPLFLHSDGAAETLSATAGSFDKFRVGFNPPLKVPRNAIQPTIALIGFDSFYTYPNLTSAAQLRFMATGLGTFGRRAVSHKRRASPRVYIVWQRSRVSYQIT